MIMKGDSLSNLARPQSKAGNASISGRDLDKIVLVSPFLCIEKPEKTVDLNHGRNLAPQFVNYDIYGP